MISRSTDIKAALRSKQRGMLLNPFRFGAPSAFPSSGLVAYYKFDANSNDSKGTDNGTDTGVTYGNAGVIGNCATFSNNRIALASGFPTGNISVSLWVRRDDTGGSEQFLYGWMGGDGITYWRMNIGGLTANRIGLFHRSLGSDFKLWDTDTLTDTSSFHHLVVTQSGTATPSIYLDNVALTVTLQASSGTLVNWTNTTEHGVGRAVSGSFPLIGRIDELGRWNRVLTPTEVGLLYNGGAGLTYP